MGERPESIGADPRGQDDPAPQGDQSQETLREQSARLIERAKAEGFFWGDDSPFLDELAKTTPLGGAEHLAFLIGEGGNRIVIRATDNGYFGPMSDISPAQYLQRLEDYNRSFPSLRMQMVGVSESPEVEGHAVIWTAQRFVEGERFRNQPALAKAMEAQGWAQVGDSHSFQFRHLETGAVIEDAHTDNVFQNERGELFPFDVRIDALPKSRNDEDVA